MARLPGAVHLIAQAPHFDVVGILHAVGDPQVAILGAGRMVAVLQQIASRINTPGTQVHCHHHVRVGLFSPRGKLIDAHQVGFGAAPSKLQPPGTLCHRPYAVLPVKIGHKVSARIPHNGHTDLANQIQHILAEPFLIRRGMSRLVNTAVNSPSQMFQKRAVNPLVHPADLKILVQGDTGKFFLHRKHPFFPAQNCPYKFVALS